MKPLRLSLATVVAATCFAIPALPASAQTQPDNSAQNQNQHLTADSQSSASSDRMITRKIRRALIADKDLSMYAHNVKIITVNGTVTLKGPVKSDDEKAKVASDASGAAAQAVIVNHLTVKTE
jgi:hyperosmotically inducible protein